MLYLFVGLYVIGLLLLMVATPEAIWDFLVLAWVMMGVFALAPIIELIGRHLH